jgi:hypothetical protein
VLNVTQLPVTVKALTQSGSADIKKSEKSDLTTNSKPKEEQALQPNARAMSPTTSKIFEKRR